MKPPRRPGDDAPRPVRPARPGARRNDPAKAEGERAAKPVRVRKDGSVASGRSDARKARTDGGPAPARERPARARPKPTRDEGSRGDVRKPRADASPAPTRERPARARPKPTRDEGSRADVRKPRTEGAPPPARERPVRSNRRPDTKPARVRADGSVAVHRTDAPNREPQRIAKLLARAGVASRREIERMIEEGRVALNGQVLQTPATILTSLRGVTVNGVPVEAPEAARLFLFHKPTGFLTTAHDPKGRPTIYDRLPQDLPRVMPVGRLDMNTEGLLLLTTDGELKRKLELPSSGIPRIYRARCYGQVAQEQLEALADGVEIEGVRYGPIDANLERRTGRNMWIEVKITEGKNREVRRVLEYLGLQVSRLIRVAYGPFLLADLPPGEVGEVKQHELVAFRKGMK